MEPREIEHELEEIEGRIERLRALYEQYFMGLEKLEPQIPRKDVERRIWVMRREHIRNTGMRFKFQMLVQRYNTFQQYWGRITREIETGTYRRDVLRAAKRFGEKEALTIVGKRRAEQFKLLAAAQKEKDERASQKTADAEQAAAPRDSDEDEAPTPPAQRVAASAGATADLAESDPAPTIRDALLPDDDDLTPVSRRAPDLGRRSPRHAPAPDPQSVESSPSPTIRDAFDDDDFEDPTPVSRRAPDLGARSPRHAPAPPDSPGSMSAIFGDRGRVARKSAATPAITPPPPNDPVGRAPAIMPPAPIAPSLDLRFGPPPAGGKSAEKARPAEKGKPADGDGDVKKRVAALAAQLKTPRGGAAEADSSPAGLDLDLDLEPSSRRRKSAMPSRRPAGRSKSVRVPPLPLPADLLAEAPPSAPQPSSRRARARDSQLGIPPKAPIRTSSKPPAPTPSPAAAQPAARAPAPTPIGGIPLTRRMQPAPSARTPASPPVPSSATAASSREAASRAQSRDAAPRPPEVERPPPAPARVEDDAGLPDQRLRQIYSKYVETRRASHESTAGLTYEKLAASLRAQAIKLKETHRKKNVDYDVIVKDGKTVLKPILR